MQGYMYLAITAAALATAIALGKNILGAVKAADDFDPVGAMIGLAALAVSLIAARQSAQALRWQEINLPAVEKHLAVRVLEDERRARQQLLGGQNKTIDVRFTLCSSEAEGADPSGDLPDIADYYMRLRPRRMVVTGAPGAGKTAMALELMLRLLEKRNSDDPVPVRLSLASWNTDQALDDWIALHISRTYRLSTVAATELVKARRVLPVLDGLDEMDREPELRYNSRASLAVRAINDYLHAVDKGQLVLTCRTTTYRQVMDLRVEVEDAAHVEICPLDEVLAKDFLIRRRVDTVRWQPVLDALEHNPQGPLGSSLSTPWRLGLAVSVYEQRDPNTGVYLHDLQNLLNAAEDGDASVANHLMSLFIVTASERPVGQRRARYTPEQVRTWLKVLATYLNANTTTPRIWCGQRLSGTDIVLHELWPLAGIGLTRSITAVLSAAPLPIGFAFARIWGLQVDQGADWLIILGSITGALWATKRRWPRPVRVDLQRLQTLTGWGIVAGWLAIGLTCGGLLSLGSLVGTPVVWLLAGATNGLLCGFVACVRVSGTAGSLRPRDPLRGDIVFLLAITFLIGLSIGVWMALLLTPMEGLAVGLVFSLYALWMAGLVGGLACLQYVALLLRTRTWSRRRLPWRLSRFLDWCDDAGLLRTAGIAYQFRHHELQEYLAS